MLRRASGALWVRVRMAITIAGGEHMARADPVTEERPSLYERDFYLWIEQQVSRLREGRLQELDVANLLEEIETWVGARSGPSRATLSFCWRICSGTGSTRTSGRVAGAALSSRIAAGCANCSRKARA